MRSLKRTKMWRLEVKILRRTIIWTLRTGTTSRSNLVKTLMIYSKDRKNWALGPLNQPRWDQLTAMTMRTSQIIETVCVTVGLSTPIIRSRSSAFKTWLSPRTTATTYLLREETGVRHSQLCRKAALNKDSLMGRLSNSREILKIARRREQSHT